MGVVRIFLMAVLFVAAGGSAAMAQSRYAAFVAEENTGEVLHSRLSDATRYPASLTKMMTLYMLFEAIEAGDASLNEAFPVSAHAANAEPSRLGVTTGDSIAAEVAIRALIIRSANDVAVVVAERLGGTEREFAAMMTRRARELGLSGTTFRNPHGLPDSEQVTTARDMARLAIALHRDFPQYFHYFGERSFRWNGRTHTSHNNLVGRMNGVDGLKTGYIRASGFNVVTTAERNGHRVVAVVMGGASATTRDAHARELIEAAFDVLETRAQTTLIASIDLGRLNPMREQDLIAREIAQLHLSPPTAQGDGETMPALRVVMAEDDAVIPVTAAVLTGHAEAPEPQPVAAIHLAAAAPAPAGVTREGEWSVQVGAYGQQAAAMARLETIAAIAPDLDGFARAARPTDRAGRTLYRARFEALSAERARAACALLAQRNEPCFAVAPGA